MTGIVLDIQHRRAGYGPGLRTVVRLKGCPLNCIWCHAPEGRSFAPELAFDASRCADALECVAACPNGAHLAPEGHHVVDFGACKICGLCVVSCPHGALRIVGREMTVDEVMESVLGSGGDGARRSDHLTLSGGEPLAQPQFTLAILRQAKAAGLHTCLDTSGAVSRDRLDAVANHVDLFLYDYKATAATAHKLFTGTTNVRPLQNLDHLVRRGARIILRCPLIPRINDTPDHLAGISELYVRYPELEAIEIIPYQSPDEESRMRHGHTHLLEGLASADAATATRWITALHGVGCENVRLAD